MEGDVVTITGTTSVFNRIDEITPSSVARTGTGGDVTPVAIGPTDLQRGSEAPDRLESLLVRVTGVSAVLLDATVSDCFWVSDDSQEACTGTNPACAYVSDFFYDGAQLNGQPAVTAGASFTSITGVVNGYQSQYSLEPRRASDLVP